ncbi:MAG: hypothetical protein IJ083_16455 [Clostridia bacterium]|nr:hypothetical protein [Clostridia bacterium]
MLKSCSLLHRITTSDTDLMGTWKCSSILGAMQDVAVEHCNQLGLGRDDILKDRLAWVVVRMQLEMERFPVLGDNVRLETFHNPVRHTFFPRYFLIRDAKSEEIIGRASSLWMLLDLDSRKSVRAPQVLSKMPINRDMAPTLPLPGNAEKLNTPPLVFSLTPSFTDLDFNRHVNNTRYLDWCCNALGVDTLTDNVISGFIIHYDREVVPTDQVRCELRRDENRFSFLGLSGENRHFEISGKLSPRI